MQLSPYFNKALQAVLGNATAKKIIDRVSPVEIEASQNEFSFQYIADLPLLGNITLTVKVLLDKERATEAVVIELAEINQQCFIPGFDQLRGDVNEFKIQIDKDKRVHGNIGLTTHIGEAALNLKGSLSKTEETYQWKADFSQKQSIAELVENSRAPGDLIDPVLDKLQIDRAARLNAYLLWEPEVITTLVAELPIKPLNLTGDLSLEGASMLLKTSYENKKVSGAEVLLEGQLYLKSKLLAQATIKANASKESASFAIQTHYDQVQKEKLTHLLSIRRALELCGVASADELPELNLIIDQLYFDTKGKFEFKGSANVDLPQVGKADVENLVFKANRSTKSFNLSGKAGIRLGESLLPEPVNSTGTLSLAKEANKPLDFSLQGDFTYSHLKFDYDLNLNDKQQSFEAYTGELSLSESLKTLTGAELPVGLPDPTLEKLSLKFIKNQIFEVKGEISNQEALSVEGSDLRISLINFHYSRKSGVSSPEVTLSTRFDINLLDTIAVDKGTFDFKLDQKGWKLNNEMDMRFFDHALNLKASYQYNSTIQSIDFEVTSFPKIEFIEGISLETKQAKLKLDKSEKSGLNLSLSATSDFISPLFSIEAGELSLTRSSRQVELKFESSQQLDLSIATLDALPQCSLAKPELHITYDTSKKEWESGGSADIQFSNIPEVVGKIFPTDALKASFSFGKKESFIMVQLAGKSGKSWELETIPLPPKSGDGHGNEELDLGNLYFGANDFKIDLKKAKLSGNVYIGLPEKLNGILKNEDGSVIEVFKTCKSTDPKGAIRFELALQGEDLSLKMLDSPLKDFKLNEEGRLVIDMKISEDMDFGAFSIVPPVFKFSGGDLVAVGGIQFERRHGLKEDEPDRVPGIPTTLFKWLLRKLNLHSAADNLVSKIPITSINFAPKVGEHRQFNSTAFLELFIRDKEHLNVPSWLKQLVGLMDQAGSKLPDAFLAYGDYKLPESFSFALEFSAPSNLKFDVSFKPLDDEAEERPLLLMIPQLPCLMGIKLNSIGFGELWNGTLFHFDIDCEYDQFDLPRMLTSLIVDAAWPDSQKYLPSPKDLHQNFRIKNLTTLIIYQTEIPIPIPLFYDEISSSQLVFEGMGAGFFISFKKPAFGTRQLKALAALTSELVRFFKNPTTYKIQWSRMQDGDLTTLIVGPNHWQYPRYIAKELTDNRQDYQGLKLGHDAFEIGAVKMLTALLSALQNGSINELIQLRDLSQRHGHKVIKVLELFDVDLKYALTTPPEFTSGEDSVRAKWRETGLFTRAKTNQFLSMLPPRRSEVADQYEEEDITIPIGDNTEGLVTFFDGKMKLGEHFNSQTSLGVILSDAGFGLGGQFDMNVGKNLVNVFMGGHALVKPDGFKLEGNAYFRMLDIEVFSSTFLMKKDKVKLTARTDFPPNPIFYIKADLNGRLSNQEFYLEGDGQLNLFGFEGTGKVLCHFSETQRKFELTQSRSLFGDLIYMNSSLAYAGGDGVESLAGDLKFRIANLIHIEAAGAVTGSADHFQLSGAVGIEMLGVKTEARGLLKFEANRFEYAGYISLLNGVIKGNVAGHITDADFELGGKGVELNIHDVSLSQTALTIQKAENGSGLVLTLKGKWLESNYHLSGALFKEELNLKGTVEPIRWLSFAKPGGDEVYMITIHNGNQGPITFEANLNQAGVKSAYFKGYVSLLGLSETGVTIKIEDGYWETDITHRFNLSSFLSSEFKLNLKMKEGYWVTGDGRLSTKISIAVPAVKFSFNVWLPFVGTKRVTTTLIPAINLGDLHIQHDLKFRIYLNEEIAEMSANLRKAIADLRKEEEEANLRLAASEKALREQKEAGGFKGHKQLVSDRYEQHKKQTKLGELYAELDACGAGLMQTMHQILDEFYDSNRLDLHEQYLDRTLNRYVRLLEEIGYNQFERHYQYQYLRSELIAESNKILNDRNLKVLIQHTDYNMTRPGRSDTKTGAEMRKKHAGDEFDLQLTLDHVRLKQGAYTLCNHAQNPEYKHYKQAMFTKQEILSSAPPSQGRRIYISEQLHAADVDLSFSYDNGLKIAHKASGQTLSFRGDHKDSETLQWRPEGQDRYKMFVQITGDTLPEGNYKIKSDYQHFVVRPGGDADMYQAEIRTEGTGDRLHISKHGSDTYKIRQAGYYVVVPGNDSDVRRADFRKQAQPNEGLTIRYSAEAGGHYISYQNYFLCAHTGNGLLEFRSTGEKTAFKLFREIESDALFRAISNFPKRIDNYFNWLDARMLSRHDQGLKSYGLFDHPVVDEFKKAHNDLAPIHYLEDKVMRDKHEVLKISETIQGLTDQLKKIREQQSSSDIHFWMEFSTEFSFAGIHFKLGQIRVNFKVTEYTNFNQCLEQIPGIVAENLRENAMRIFSGQPLPDHSRNYARSLRRSAITEPQPDFSKLNKEYDIEEKSTNEIEHNLDEFL